CRVFLFVATATTDRHTLSLHDALPISEGSRPAGSRGPNGSAGTSGRQAHVSTRRPCAGRPAGRSLRPASSCVSRRSVQTGTVERSEEHTSELQSRENLVCRLLLEKKNT